MDAKKIKLDLNVNDTKDFCKKELVINDDYYDPEASQIPKKIKFASNFFKKPVTSGHNVNSDSSSVDDDDESHSEPDDNINLRVSSKQISEFCQVIFVLLL